MYKIISITLLMAMATSTFSQQTSQSHVLPKQDYLRKSKRQKQTANIILIGGTSIVLAGFMMPRGEKIITELTSWGWYPLKITSYKNDRFKAQCGAFGILAMLGSIPIYLGAHRNKKKSLRVAVSNEKFPLMRNGSFITQTVPSIALKIKI